MPTPSSDFTSDLRGLMDQASISTFTDLCLRCRIPRSQLTRLRRGQIGTLPLESAQSIALNLEISLDTLIQIFDNKAEDRPVSTASSGKSDAGSKKDTQALDQLRQEYTRLQQHLETHEEVCRETFQREALDVMESLILQLPTAAHAATKNPTAPAVRLLPLLKPIDRLLEQWNITVIGSVGEMMAYKPQAHQWMGAGDVPSEGDLVRIRYVGYRQGDRLLHRAKVSQG